MYTYVHKYTLYIIDTLAHVVTRTWPRTVTLNKVPYTSPHLVIVSHTFPFVRIVCVYIRTNTHYTYTHIIDTFAHVVTRTWPRTVTLNKVPYTSPHLVIVSHTFPFSSVNACPTVARQHSHMLGTILMHMHSVMVLQYIFCEQCERTPHCETWAAPYILVSNCVHVCVHVCTCIH